MEFTLRNGRDDDATAAITVLRRSIVELCGADHGNDADEIASLTANKSEATWCVWAARDDARLIIAERGAGLLGVGMVDAQGMILLNYVSPDARFGGVSTAILSELENVARGFGEHACTLESTKTAQAFYESRGYTFDDAPRGLMRKAL